jgi:hypothetical protein
MMETESHVRCWQPETPPVAQRPAGDLGTAYRLQELADNPTKPVTAEDITQACCHICELTGVGEREIREGGAFLHARSPAIVELRASRKTDPALSSAAGGGSFNAVICRRPRE